MGLPELCTSDSFPLKATSSTATSLQEGNVPMLRSSKEASGKAAQAWLLISIAANSPQQVKLQHFSSQTTSGCHKPLISTKRCCSQHSYPMLWEPEQHLCSIPAQPCKWKMKEAVALYLMLPG